MNKDKAEDVKVVDDNPPMQVMYDCYFQFQGFTRCTRARNLSSFRDGFWINTTAQFTQGNDALFFVMPTNIHYIEKMFVDPDKK